MRARHVDQQDKFAVAGEVTGARWPTSAADIEFNPG
jgi:hypothetical protein